jgi:hypothetical protein
MEYSFMARAAILAAAALLGSAVAGAQDRVLRVVSSDSQPVAYAYVSVQGGHPQLTDEQGLVGMGPGKKQTLSVEVRRIGYTPYFGKMDFPDTAATLTVILPRLSQNLAPVKVTASKVRNSLEMSGYYRRALQGQKGALSAVFIGPEEIEKRNSSRVSALLTTVNGISFGRTGAGHTVIESSGGSCAMDIVMDGRQVCPAMGCQGTVGAGTITDQKAVLIDEVVDLGSVAAIEVYKRGGNMPSDFHVNGDCGIVAIWTGSRKP